MADRQPDDLVEIGEPGRGPQGEPMRLDRRLFFQFLAFGECRDTGAVADALKGSGMPAVLYADVNDHLGIGVLSFSEDPAFFPEVFHPLLRRAPFDRLLLKQGLTMLGRTYSRGYEQDLVETLIDRPKRRVLDPELRWAVWYPLRRSGGFERLDEKEQRAILAEHGAIGHAFGRAGLAHDVRLDCHGLSPDDNDFVIGILGRELYPLSLVVQRMRKTRQTSQYLTRLGPFFTGKVICQVRGEKGSNSRDG